MDSINLYMLAFVCNFAACLVCINGLSMLKFNAV